MEDPGGPYRIGLISLLLVCSALFSASETALFSVPRLKLKELAKRGGSLGRIAAQFLVEPERILSTILVSNTLVNVFFTSTLTVFVLSTLRMGREAAEAIAAGSAFALLLLFGEIGPKTFASLNPQIVLNLTTLALLFAVRIFSPLSTVLMWGRKFFLAMYPDPSDATHVSQENLIDTAVSVGEQAGTVTPATGATSRNIFAADNTPLRAVMTPRANMQAVSDKDSISDVAKVMVDTGLSRLPVYKDSVDHLVGIVHLKDLLPKLSEPLSVVSLLRPIHKAKASDNVPKVLRDLQLKRLHMCA
ncbi:MAG: CNNM domain-containing protein, partial [Bacillota bacterium]|nr:CNNM domain-containing protein [Bacillota bacterium]